MKLPIFITGGALVLALSIWCAIFFVDHQRNAIPSSPANSISPKTSTLPAEKNDFTGNTVISNSTPVARTDHRIGGNIPPPPAVPSVPVPRPASVARQSSSTASKKLTQATAVSRVSGAPAARSPMSTAGPGVLEVDQGVPVPAAFMPSQENLSPAAASAQQQLADSFVANATSPPAAGNSQTTAGQNYYNALSNADEQYRSLYGDAAYNSASIQAGIDAAGTGK